MKYRIRTLDKNDFSKNYLNLMSQLSPVDIKKVTKLEFVSWVEEVNNNIGHNIFVIENVDNADIIASGTLLIEPKLIHSFGYAGHIEDIIVDKSYRGCGLGKIIVSYLIEHAKILKCYKVILNCSDKYVQFYKKLGLNKKDNTMSLYFN